MVSCQHRKRCTVLLRWGIFIENLIVFTFLKAVLNIPLQTLIISPWLFRKMIISQLELRLPVVRRHIFYVQIDNNAKMQRWDPEKHRTKPDKTKNESEEIRSDSVNDGQCQSWTRTSHRNIMSVSWYSAILKTAKSLGEVYGLIRHSATLHLWSS